ncbi:MAG: rhodanese-like domain-containing protein [Alphaproteobacteria bacterium]|nr:rhodanese-like domain-containing protein [Alphaproteobacteria bacterium]
MNGNAVLILIAPLAVFLFYKFGYVFGALIIVYLLAMYGYPYVRRLMRGKGVAYIEPEALEKQISEKKDMLMIDLRSSVDFYGMFGHVDGAVNLPFEAFMNRINETADRLAGFKETPIVIIGLRDENEVYKAYTALKQKGFVDVHVLNFGISRWLRRGFPTVERNVHKV